MSHETKHDSEDAFGLRCGCGEVCWAARDTAITTLCSGEMNVSEDFPGTYTHFCDGHGHYEDLAERRTEPKDVKK